MEGTGLMKNVYSEFEMMSNQNLKSVELKYRRYMKCLKTQKTAQTQETHQMQAMHQTQVTHQMQTTHRMLQMQKTQRTLLKTAVVS